jgi:hypothetical protein
MKYLMLTLILISWKDFSKFSTFSSQQSIPPKSCLLIESESDFTVAVSNACPICMNGMIVWKTGDSTKFTVAPFGPNGYAIVKVPNYPNQGKISKEWPCK